MIDGLVSGSRVTFVGGAMAAVVQGVIEVRMLIGLAPVIVGGLAVLSRLSSPHRATVDLDVVDHMPGGVSQLEVLRSATGARPVEPAAVLLPTAFGEVRVDVLEVRQVELDRLSDDPGDRLHASSHAWANDTATALTIEVILSGDQRIEVTTPVAEAGPLIAMKLQAVMNRSAQKQGTDLLDIVRLTFDREARPKALTQIGAIEASVARDIARHVDLWFVRSREQTLQRIRGVGGSDVALDDIDLVAELLNGAAARA